MWFDQQAFDDDRIVCYWLAKQHSSRLCHCVFMVVQLVAEQSQQQICCEIKQLPMAMQGRQQALAGH